MVDVKHTQHVCDAYINVMYSNVDVIHVNDQCDTRQDYKLSMSHIMTVLFDIPLRNQRIYINQSDNKC